MFKQNFRINLGNENQGMTISILSKANDSLKIKIIEPNSIENKNFIYEIISSKTNDIQKNEDQINRKESNKLPDDFINAIRQYCVNTKSNSVRVKNCVNYYVEELIHINNLQDFKRLRGLGSKSIFGDNDFLLGLLELTKKIRTQEIT